MEVHNEFTFAKGQVASNSLSHAGLLVSGMS